MTLSIKKLDKLLASAGLIIENIFIMDGLCVYLEIMSTNNAENFLLYIPSKYEIKAEDRPNVFELKDTEISENGNIADDYAGALDNFGMEEEYGQIELCLSGNNNKDNLEEKMEEDYNHPLSLKDIHKQDMVEVKDIYRQLKRLKFCLNGIQYKMSIIFKHYLCCIRRDDSIEVYTITNYPSKGGRSLFISTDLECLYEKIKSVNIDVKTVREGIYKVLDKNQIKHSQTLIKLFEQSTDITNKSQSIYNRKIKYSIHVSNLTDMLTQLYEKENTIIEKLLETNRDYGDAGLTGMHNDIEKYHKTANLEKEIDSINEVKKEIITNIVDIRHKHEELTLTVDKIFFDTSIMLDAILKNMAILETL
jgi:hypothetical protein